MTSLTDDEIARIARSYLTWALNHASLAPKAVADGPIPIADNEDGHTTAQSIYQFADGDPKSEQKAIESRLENARADLAAHTFDWAIRGFALEFSKDAGIERLPEDGDNQAALLRAISRARIEEYRILLAQSQGNYADTAVRDPLFRGLKLPLVPKWASPRQTKPSVPTLGQLAERYIEAKSRDAWVGKTHLDNKRVLGWFLDLNAPDMPITAVSLDMIRTYRDALNRIPANTIKLKEFNGRTLSEIIALARDRQDLERLSGATTAKYFSKLKAFFAWCLREGYIDSSPVRNLTLSPPRNAKDRRYPFSTDQLNQLFTSPQYKGHTKATRRSWPGKVVVRDGKFWIPLIALYSGMRLGEIVQLLVADVKEVDGVWCIDVSRTEESAAGPKKQIKTESSVRLIPIHPMLRKIGLIAYAHGVRKKDKTSRLFPEVNVGKTEYYSHTFSKYFARYIADIGIKTAKHTFHSFRHNFADACDSAGMQQQIKKALMGHSDTGVTAIYGSKPPARLLYDSIKQLKYNLDLAHLLPEAKVV